MSSAYEISLALELRLSTESILSLLACGGVAEVRVAVVREAAEMAPVTAEGVMVVVVRAGARVAVTAEAGFARLRLGQRGQLCGPTCAAGARGA
jgi:hypothetical protein